MGTLITVIYLYFALFSNCAFFSESKSSAFSQKDRNTEKEKQRHEDFMFLPFLSSCLVHFYSRNFNLVDQYNVLPTNQLYLVSNPVNSQHQNQRDKQHYFYPFMSQLGKWQRCHIFIIGLSDLVQTSSPVLFNNDQFVQENPKIVLIIYDIQQEEHFVSKILIRLRSIVVQSNFLVFNPFSKALSLINLLAVEYDKKFVSINFWELGPSCDVISAIEKQHKINLQNFNDLEVQTPDESLMYNLLNLIPPHCSRLGEDFGGTPIYCTIKLLWKTLNFSAESAPSLKNKIGTLIMPTGAVSSSGTLWPEGKEILVQVLSSKHSLPFGFVIVIDKSQVHLANPIAAFDKFTRLGILTSIVLLSLVIIIITAPEMKFFLMLKCFMNTFAALLFVVFEQAPGKQYFLHRKMKTTAIKLLLLIWLYVCIVISGGYRGVFYSVLTKRKTPIVPRNFEELSKSDYLPVAIDSIPINYTSFLPYFKHITNDYLKSVSEQEELFPSVLKRKRIFSTLLKRTIHLTKLTYSKIKVSYDSRKSIPVEYHDKPRDFIIPSSFAALSSSEGVEYFSYLMGKSGNYFLLKSQQWDGFIATENEFVCTRNFLLGPITKVYMRIQQSGLYDLWRKYSLALLVTADLHIMRCLENLLKANWEDQRFYKYETCFEAIRFHKGTRLNRPGVSTKLRAATSFNANQILVVFVGMGIGITAALLAFFVELGFQSILGLKRLCFF